MSKFEMPDFLQKIQQEPFREGPDCNYCCWLNLTEAEQQQVYNKTIFTEHACMLYGERLLHRTNHVIHSPRICPCDECIADNNENFRPRKERFDD